MNTFVELEVTVQKKRKWGHKKGYSPLKMSKNQSTTRL